METLKQSALELILDAELLAEEVRQRSEHGKEIDIKPIADRYGYYACSNGEILSRWKRGVGGIGREFRKLKCRTMVGGYLQVRLGRVKQRLAHRVILETFVGKCPKGMQCCHNNSNPADNRLANLRWDTIKNNHRDAVNRGTHTGLKSGEDNANSKLKHIQVRVIRHLKDINPNFKNTNIAKIFGVASTTIQDIIKNRTWKT